MPRRRLSNDCRLNGILGRLAGNERVKGIEPSSVAWKATALPLSYTRGAVNCRDSGALPSSFSGVQLLECGGAPPLWIRPNPKQETRHATKRVPKAAEHCRTPRRKRQRVCEERIAASCILTV